MANRKNKGGYKNRSRLEIYAEILESAMGGIRKTNLMRSANLSYHQTNDHIPDLLNFRLLEELSDGSFKTTERGLGFLKSYREAASYLQPENPGNHPHIISNGNGRFTIARPYT
jgi:predicted transcriptional regulator